MKAQLYAIDRGSTLRWRYTIRPEVDIGYTVRLYESVCFVWLEPFFSLGQARMFAERLNAAGSRVKPDEPDTIRRELTRTLERLGMSTSIVDNVRTVRAYVGRSGGSAEQLQTKLGKMEAHYGAFVGALEGRQLLEEEIVSLVAQLEPNTTDGWDWQTALQYAYLQGDVELATGISADPDDRWWRRRTIRYTCSRCGSGIKRHRRTRCPECGDDCPYCEECLTMGRSRFCTLVACGRKEGAAPSLVAAPESGLERWGLSPAQEGAVAKALAFMADERSRGQRFLLWAVTGAGKTEMLFPLIERALSRGERVLLATPRRDVVLELLPRVRKAFPREDVIGLYGGSGDRWGRAGIVIATTHQVMRFHAAFELVIIDEMDAYPFHNNPMLQYAAVKAGTEAARTVMLSATPPEALRREAEHGKLAHAKVPVRYHRNPLPIPRVVPAKPAARWLQRGVMPGRLKHAIEQSVERGAQVFVFVPRIKLVDPMVGLLKQAFVGVSVDGTSSEDRLRADKVSAFRDKSIDILVTTTILERGVTIPKSDVMIIDADSPLFDTAALIQMAGRAGRSALDPAGRVTFLTAAYTRSQRGAIRQLKQMNRLARAEGYLVKEEGQL